MFVLGVRLCMHVADNATGDVMAGLFTAGALAVALMVWLAIYVTRLRCENEELHRCLANDDSVSRTQAGALRVIGQLTQVARRDGHDHAEQASTDLDPDQLD